MSSYAEQIIKESINEDEPVDMGKESCPFYYPTNSGCNTQLFSTCFHVGGEEYHSCIAYQDSINDLN
ncbi:MAG: hypothetical protein AABW91_02810 [Nanoarchaeota archaeon]